MFLTPFHFLQKDRLFGAKIWVHLNCTNCQRQVRQEWDHTPKAREHLDQTGEAMTRKLIGKMEKDEGGSLSWGLLFGKKVLKVKMYLAQSWDWFTHLFICFMHSFNCCLLSVYTHLSQTTVLDTFGQDLGFLFMKEVGFLVMLKERVEKR